MAEDLRPFARRTLVVIGLVALVAAVLTGLVVLFDALLLAFGGILLAVLLDGLACGLAERIRIGRGLALAIVAVTITAALVGAGWYVGPSVAAQMDDLRQALISGYESLRATMATWTWAGSISEGLPSAEELGDRTSMVLDELPGLFSTAVGVVTTLLIIVFLGLFFAADPDLYVRGAVSLVPKSRRPRAREVLASVARALRKWLLGQFILMTFVGVCVTVGLLLLDAPLAISLGILAFVFDFIPIIGPFLAGVPAVLIAFIDGPEKAIQVFVLFNVVQTVESYAVAPYVQKQVVSLPPVMLLLSQVLMAGVAGLVGVTLATPLAVAVIVLVQMLYVEDVLGDRDVQILGDPGLEAEGVPSPVPEPPIRT